MLPVSDRFRELMNSNIRPKCEPVITVKDALGTGRDLVWTGKNITKLTFKRGIDPIGRTLPFMELRWTEVYQGKLNENAYPQIYENVIAFLPVELKFKQKLDFETEDEEEFTFPTMFLSAKPTLKENTIEWVAYDLMHFLNTNQSIYFDGNSHVDKCISFVLRNCCSSHLDHKEIIESIQKTISKVTNDSTYPNGTPIFFDGPSNSFLKDFWAIHSYYWDFSENYMKYGHIFDFVNTGFRFTLSLQYKNPIITKNQDISIYQYKRYYLQENLDGQYEKEWDSYEKFISSNDPSQDLYIFKYLFNGYGKAVRASQEEYLPINGNINTAFSFKELPIGTVPTKDQFKIIVIPIETNSIEEVIKNNVSGEAFTEDNKLSHYISTASEPVVRNNFLKKYFNKKCDSLEMECAPNVSLETGDIVQIETNLEDGLGNNKTKNAVIVEFELEYSGKLSQKIKAHEVI